MTAAASPSRYVSLHTHSEHSELDSLAKISDLFARTAALGQPALAITDHGTLGGLWKAQNAADLHGVKLIPGIEAYLAIGDRFQHNQVELADGELADDSDDSADADDEAGGLDENGEPKPAKARTKTKKYEHLTLLAVSETGWRNLVRINNAAQKTKWGTYARVDYALVKQHAEGVVILSGCLGGPILGPLSRGDYSQAEANLLTMIATVGRENVYVEVMEHGIESESAILHLVAQLAQEHGIPLVATNDSHHTHAHDADAHDAWLAVSTKALVSDQKRYRFSGIGYHHRSEEEMLDLRPEAWWAEAVANTMLVADRVEGRVLPRPAPKLPAFPTPDGSQGAQRPTGIRAGMTTSSAVIVTPPAARKRPGERSFTAIQRGRLARCGIAGLVGLLVAVERRAAPPDGPGTGDTSSAVGALSACAAVEATRAAFGSRPVDSWRTWRFRFCGRRCLW